MQFDWMPWNLRAHHVNTAKIRQEVAESKRIENLASEYAEMFVKLTVQFLLAKNHAPLVTYWVHRWTFQIVLNAIFAVDSVFYAKV